MIGKFGMQCHCQPSLDTDIAWCPAWNICFAIVSKMGVDFDNILHKIYFKLKSTELQVYL